MYQYRLLESLVQLCRAANHMHHRSPLCTTVPWSHRHLSQTPPGGRSLGALVSKNWKAPRLVFALVIPCTTEREKLTSPLFFVSPLRPRQADCTRGVPGCCGPYGCFLSPHLYTILSSIVPPSFPARGRGGGGFSTGVHFFSTLARNIGEGGVEWRRRI